MTDPDPRSHDGGASDWAGATATAAPPTPPAGPPHTGTATPPPPGGRSRAGLIAGLLVVVVVLVALGGLLWWNAGRHASEPSAIAGGSPSAFASAMRKAGVSAPSAPARPVALTSVKASGSHHFEATFSAAELTALIRSFSYSPTSGPRMELAVESVALGTKSGTLRVTGAVNASGSTYSGWVEAPVRFSAGTVQLAGDASVNAGGLEIGGSRAAQVAGTLVGYVNEYLAAAPGLIVNSAVVVPGQGAHVTGTAPDSIRW